MHPQSATPKGYLTLNAFRICLTVYSCDRQLSLDVCFVRMSTAD